LKGSSNSAGLPATQAGIKTRLAKRWGIIFPAGIAVVMLAAGTYAYLHRRPKLTKEDMLVLADFTNTTGDPVFDDTLKQAISVQLAQSPFLNILSSARTR